MNIQKNLVVAISIVIIFLGGVYVVVNKNSKPVGRAPMPVFNFGVYINTQYGFSIDLPESWKRYTVINKEWTGSNTSFEKAPMITGPMVVLRHPLWTEANHREDMPVMVFTLAQWEQVKTENIVVGAAPIPPSLLGQNSKYAFALPARYNFDYSVGFEEVDKLVHTLKAMEPTAY